MMQLNLLPDVKLKYVKAQRAKRTVLLSAVIVSGAAITVVIILGSIVYGAQKIQLSHYDSEIKKSTSQLQKIDGLNKILTVQNQLNSLSDLHAQKPVTSRLFTFLPQITPTGVNISTFDLNLSDSTIQIDGSAGSLEAVNKFVDTLKFTNFTTDQGTDKSPAFSSVVLTTFSKTDKDTTYSVNLKFDQKLFSSSYKNVTLVVPNITTTRSQTESPDVLFSSPKTNQGQ